MTDATAPAPAAQASGFDWSGPKFSAHLAKRKRSQFWLKAAGVFAISFAFATLFLLIASLVSTGWQAFRQTHATIEVYVNPDLVSAEDPYRANWRRVMQDAMQATFPEVEGAANLRKLNGMLSNGAAFIVRDRVVANPALIGREIIVTVPFSDPYDQLAKGLIDRETPEEFRRLKADEIAWFDDLQARGLVSKPFNWTLFTSADSRFPELAGLRGALLGTFWALLVCFLISFPVGIGAAIYLEEFAKKDRWNDIIEININNLAAVPSVVFGLLALAVFLGWFGMQRSAPFVGGLTLALMTLPTIIIATRAALKAVPPSIREAALGVGASKQQVVFGHVLPLAMPGILTGTIIGLAQALGETAPLLLIGMNAFITSAPTGPFDSSTALPTQIFIWADSPERGFVSRTSAAILVLLTFLIFMNGLAIYLRRKFERKW